MTEITLKIDGMQCGMCETHINNVVRNAVKVKKITSSHKKNETVIIADDDIDRGKLKSAIEQNGYKVISVSEKPYVKKGLFFRT